LQFAESKIFIADAGRKLVHIYGWDGKFITSLGRRETNDGVPWFIVPSPYFDLAIDNNDKLWVANPGKHELDQYALDGELISSWDATSTGLEGFCGCCNPIHFALTSTNEFVTSEKGLVRVKMYSDTGVFQTIVAGPDSFDRNALKLDIAVDSNNRILVLDSAAGKVIIFEKINQES